MSSHKKPEPTSSSGPWTREELLASVDAYLSMYEQYLADEPFVKNDFYRDLSSRFGRSEGSFEWRFLNISHVLNILGKKALPGLLPATNVGHWVIDSISTMLKARTISHLPNLEDDSISEKVASEPVEHTEQCRDLITVIELDRWDVSQIATALPPEVSQLPVSELEPHISVRTFNVLIVEIEVLEDLIGYSDGDLLSLRNFGETSLADLKAFLMRAAGPGAVLKKFKVPLTGSVPIPMMKFDVSEIAAALPPDVSQLPVLQLEPHVSVRTFNVLKEEIEVLENLIGYSDGDLLSFRNFGETSLADLKKFLLQAAGPMCNPIVVTGDFFKSVGIDTPAWLLELELAYLNLSMRVKNVMKSLGVERLEDLRCYNPSELLALHKFGETSLADLCEAIQERIIKGPPEKEPYPDTLMGAVGAAISALSERNSSILRLRFGISEKPGDPLVDPATLEECGASHEVTRERVRQIVKKKVAPFQIQRWVLILKERLSGLLDGRSDFLYLVDLPAEDPWFLGCDGSSDAFKSILKTFCPKFHCYEDGDRSGKYVVSDFNKREFRRAEKVVSKYTDTLSPILMNELRSQFSASTISKEQFDNRTREKYTQDEDNNAIRSMRELLPVAAQKYVGGFIRLANLKPQTISARVVPTVASFGESGATFEQIVKAGQFEGSERGLRNHLLSTPEISKIGPSKFALKIYNHETYETVSEELVQRIKREGGATSFSALIAELKVQFNLKEPTIVTYANSPRFVLDGDVLRLATALEIKEIPPNISDTKDWWKLSAGVFRTIITITHDIKRGMGFAITNGVAAALGIQFGETQTFVLDSEDLSDDSEGLTVRVSWPETALFPTISALRLALEHKNMQDCSHVALDFDTNKHTVNLQNCDMDPFHAGGISLPPMGPGIEFQKDALTEISNRMGLSRALSQVCEALIRRRLPDVAEDLASLGDGADWPGADRLVAKLKSDLSYRGSFELKDSEWGGPLQSLRLRHPSSEVALLNPQLLLYSKDLSARNDVGMLIDTKAVRSLPGQGLNTVDLLVHVGYLPERDVYILFDHTGNSALSKSKKNPEWFNRNLVDKVMLGSSGILVSREQHRLYVAALSTRLDEAFKMLFEERINRCLGD
jgi:DNA-directed RNA polymerase alpha subunit